MGTMTSQITSLTIVYSSVYSGADQRKHQSSASLAFVSGIRWPVNSPRKGPVKRKMFPFDDVIMWWLNGAGWGGGRGTSVFIPHLGAIFSVLGPWGSVSNTAHGGSRIFRWSDWLYHLEQMRPIWGSELCQNFFVWNILFQGEINFPNGELIPRSLYGDKLSLCRA